MKKLLLVLSWLFALGVHADPVSVDVQNVPVKDLIRLVYGELLDVNYLMDSSIQDDLRPVSMNVKKMEPKQLEALLRNVMKTQGLGVEHRDGVYIVGKAAAVPDPEKETFIYKPQNRDVSYLTELLTGMFPPGSFATQRGGQVSLGQIGGGSMFSQSVLPGGVIQPQAAQQGINKTLDQDSDTLIFTGSMKDILKLEKLLAQLDTESGEVMVKAVIYEVQTTKKEGSAIDLAVSILSGKIGLKLDGSAAAVGQEVFAKFATGGINLQVVFSALNTDERFKVVSSPRVRVRSGGSAHFSVGDETPVLGSVSYDQNGKGVQSVSYKSSGVIFDLKPKVRQHTVDLKLTQQISSFIPTTNGVNSTPTLTKRELSTDLTMTDGEVIVIGGLESNKETKTDSGLSFLPSIFRTQASNEGKTEIVLMLHLQKI